MALIAWLIGAALSVSLLAQPVPDVAVLRDKLDAYLLEYQDKLSAVVAVELFAQEIDGTPVNDRGRVTFRQGRRRTMDSEVSFGSLPGEGGWLGFRRVRRVDGKSIGEATPSTDELLRNKEQLEVAKALLEQGARHNLGSFRNTNLPNLPLEMLHPRNRSRFEYSLGKTARVDGTRVTMLVAQEHSAHSIIRDVDGADMPSTVTAWVDSEGRLLQAEVRSRLAVGLNPQLVLFVPTIRVKFKFNRQLGLLVPVEMREEFWNDVEGRRGIGVARYREFRRFETSARIIQ